MRHQQFCGPGRSVQLRRALDEISSPRHHNKKLFQLLRALGALIAVFVTGTVGFHHIGEPSGATWLDAAYMTVITLTTVGFSEAIPIHGDEAAEFFTICLIVFGMGTFLYFVSTLTAFVVEGELLDILWRRGVQKKIDRMDGHVVVAGLGQTGSYVVPQVLASERDCVLIEQNVSAIMELFGELGAEVPFVEGDATDDQTLIDAGVERASGIVFSLGNDRDNLFATISARRLNSSAAIVTRGEDPRSEKKFRMAGATSVIYTNVLGGIRMASEVLRPEVTTFLDLMMEDHGHYRTVDEFHVPDDSPLIGRSLRDLGLRQISDALVIAVRDGPDEPHTFNPGPDYTVKGDSKLILLLLLDDIPKIEELIGGSGGSDW